MESIQSLSRPIIPVAHLVIALNNGGLEHLVMRWTAYRNQLLEGSTHIICLDELGTLASEFQGGPVHCINAARSKFPWDRTELTSRLKSRDSIRASISVRFSCPPKRWWKCAPARNVVVNASFFRATCSCTWNSTTTLGI